MGVIKLCTGWMVTSLPLYNDDDLLKRNENVRHFMFYIRIFFMTFQYSIIMMYMFLGLARKIQTILEESISFKFLKSCIVHLTTRDQHQNMKFFMKSIDIFLGETFYFPQGSKGLICNHLQRETFSFRISLFSIKLLKEGFQLLSLYTLYF